MFQSANDLPALSIRRPFLVTVMNLLIIIAGIGAILGVEVREVPDVDRPIVTVRAEYPGGSPETIDAEITSMVERAVARVNGVKEVRSSSEEDNFRIRVVFSSSINLVDAANDVREAVSRVERELPEGVQDIFVIKADADATAVVNLAISSHTLQIDKLTRLVSDQIIPELTSVDGVADVNLFGERKRTLRVVLDPMRLAAHRLSVADVARVMRDARYDVPAGSFESSEQEVLVRADASVTKPEDIRKLIVRNPIRLGEVADIYFAPADPENYVRLNGRTIINLGIIRQPKSNTVTISEKVGQVVARLNRQFPQISIENISDGAVFVKGAIREVLVSLAFTIIIVVSVIALFIGRLRAAFIPAVAIPVSLIGAVAAIWLLGFSINLITLLALVLASGIVVDDAIVVLENIQRLRAQGIEPRAASVVGTRQVFFAVIATTLTLISVFIPISFLPTMAGKLFQEFGFVLAVTVSLSSFVALTMVPIFAAMLPDPKEETQGELRGMVERFGNAAKEFYGRTLKRVLDAPLVVFGICAVVIACAGVLYQSLGEELVPKEDRGNIIIRLTGPDGTGLSYMDRQIEKVEQILMPYVEKGTVKKLFSITGRYDLNRGWVEAPLSDWSDRDETEGEIAKKLKKKLNKIPGAHIRIRRGNSLKLRNVGGGLEIAMTGANYTRIFEETKKFVVAMEEEIPQLSNFRVEFRATQPELSVAIDRQKATDLGVSLEDLSATVRVLADQDEIAEMSINDEAVPIILQASKGAIRQPSDLNNLYVSATGGRLVPLSQLVTFSENSIAAELDRHGQRRAIEVDADVADEMTLREAVNQVRSLAQRKLPEDVGVIFLDQAAELEETTGEMRITYLIAFIVVFLVLVAQFEGIMSAAVVLLTVPFGICAAIFALALTGTSINIYSQIGILMLIGIMAKNSILMVEFADQLREEGKSVADATREASMVRLRPIVMTMVSTILAGLPLILFRGAGAEARSAIGWVVFGGLGLAAVFTLFLTPTFYQLMAGFSKPRNKARDTLDEQLEKASQQTA
jgi:hydrophobic/amphiphilic exporter-1 (mainly G- bacteria), HAE1 family